MSSRLTLAAHILGMLAWSQRTRDVGVSSNELAESIGTHPVAVRRVLAKLSGAGLIESRRGNSGGSRLTVDPREITLRDAYEAVTQESDMIIGRYPQTPSRTCVIAPTIEGYLGEVFGEAEEALLQRLEAVSIDEMSREISNRLGSQR